MFGCSFCRFANTYGGAKISIIQILLFGNSFFPVHSAVVKCQANILPFGFNRRLWLAGLVRKDRTVWSINLTWLRLKLLRYMQIKVLFSPFEELNLIVMSKTVHVEWYNSADNLTIKLHLFLGAKEIAWNLGFKIYIAFFWSYLLMANHWTNCFLYIFTTTTLNCRSSIVLDYCWKCISNAFAPPFANGQKLLR